MGQRNGTLIPVSAAADCRTLLICAATDFLEFSRSDNRDAVLWTMRMEAPNAGLP